ncbi:uncharacterized protein LOC123711930 [Pieris brassicae]|uniref:uncharacterized protein LOC123711930 n=1 Tax=Pieris brassicae TaxID=7116 RepID=UPI001E66248C|nr:uncharacterized protein LOC123711930 [Pieris brassicae]
MSLSDRCCFPGCYESGNSHKILYSFPSPTCDLQRFRSWVYAIGGDILHLDNFYIQKYCRVCRYHFEEKYFCSYNGINNIAIPTLDMSENDGNVDHNYCQLKDDNYCPETVAVEYEIISDNMQITDLSNEAIEEVFHTFRIISIIGSRNANRSV